MCLPCENKRKHSGLSSREAQSSQQSPGSPAGKEPCQRPGPSLDPAGRASRTVCRCPLLCACGPGTAPSRGATRQEAGPAKPAVIRRTRCSDF